MLLQFEVENYKSIKDPVTLTFLTKNTDEKDENIYIPKNPKYKFGVRNKAAIFGANASGKTNVLEALALMVVGVISSKNNKEETEIPVDTFKFDKETQNSTSNFEVRFLQNDIKYIYGFKANKEEIIEEYLYHVPNNRESCIFFRAKDESKNKGLKAKYLKECGENRLYLSVASHWKDEKVKEAYSWFKNIMPFVDKDSYNSDIKDFTLKKIANEPELLSSINKYITESDIHIKNIAVDVIDSKDILEKLKIEGRAENLPEDLKNELLSSMGFINIKTKHEINGELFELEFQDESHGSQTLFFLLGVFIDTFRRNGLLIIDEFESSLHPAMAEALIKFFNSSSSNSQLIFTSHNVNLLDTDLFDKEEIWFVEKNKATQGSDLYSLAEIKGLRKDENTLKNYLLGRYGAIPFINLIEEYKCND